MNEVAEIKIDDFDYFLPENKIALHPVEKRDNCRLLYARGEGKIEDKIFTDIPKLIESGSLIVYNNTKVINARLQFRKGENNEGANIEIFCLEPESPSDYARNFSSNGKCSWKCFVGNSKKWKKDTDLVKEIHIDNQIIRLRATRIEWFGNIFSIEFNWDNPNYTFSDIIEKIGKIPIPPYLNRETKKNDETDYQTIYSRVKGSVAAPTAGLHFTENIFNELDNKGIERKELTLHVGAGTFQPVKTENIGGHVMHSEFISVPLTLISELITALKERKKIIAVGTTTVRTLESLYFIGCLIKESKWEGSLPQWYAYQTKIPKISVQESLKYIIDSVGTENLVGNTKLLIAPGFHFRIVDSIITNFHQPKSTLLLLVSAFLMDKNGGANRWKEIYEHALANNYRFLSYGDACLFR